MRFATPGHGGRVGRLRETPAAASGADATIGVAAGVAEAALSRAPLRETFWAARLGAVVDRFGIEWAVNCEQPAEVAP